MLEDILLFIYYYFYIQLYIFFVDKNKYNLKVIIYL